VGTFLRHSVDAFLVCGLVERAIALQSSAIFTICCLSVCLSATRCDEKADASIPRFSH